MQVRRFALAAILIVIVAACGRGSETDTASEPTEPAVTDAPDASDAPTDGPEETEGPDPTDAAPTRVGLDEGGFGDLGIVCSPGDATPVEDEPGVDGTTVNVATFSDPGFAGRPGLNQEFFDTGEAVVEWCNEHGGVGGYEINLNLRDAALTEYLPRMVEACDADFFMVGGGAVFDDTGQPERLGCGLPDIAGYVVTGAAADADIVLQPVPNPLQTLPVGDFRWLGDQFPDATSKIGVFTGDLPTTVTVAERYKEGVDQLGWEIVYDSTYNVIGESNWKPFAQAMRDAGVEGLIYVGEPANLAALLQAMADIEWEPAFVRSDANMYDQSLVDIAGDSARSTFLRIASWPFELADENDAVSDYFELMETYRPSGKFPAQLGMQGLSSWMLFLTSLGTCAEAGDVSRDCVYTAAAANTEWTAGGLHAPTDQSTQAPSDCFALMEVTADGFVPVDVTGFGASDLDDLYACDPSFNATLTGDYGAGARCPSGVEEPLPSQC